MNDTTNATPPNDTPDQLIIMDQGLAKNHPDKVFHLRINLPDGQGIDIVDLYGVSTMPQARKMARDKGYEPTHHMTINEAGHASRPFPF